MKIERTVVKEMPVRANWFVTPSPQSTTYAEALLTITCAVLCRVRPGIVGAGPPPLPRITSLVPLASFRAAWTFCAVESSRAVWETRELAATNNAGIVAKPASSPRRETLDSLDGSVTVSLLSGHLVGALRNLGNLTNMKPGTRRKRLARFAGQDWVAPSRQNIRNCPACPRVSVRVSGYTIEAIVRIYLNYL